MGPCQRLELPLSIPAAIQAELTIQAKGRREKPRRALRARCARAATPPARSGPWSPPFPHFSPGMHGILTALRRAEAAARERRRPGPANGTSRARRSGRARFRTFRAPGGRRRRGAVAGAADAAVPWAGLAPAARVPCVLLSQCARAHASAVPVSAVSASVWTAVVGAPDATHATLSTRAAARFLRV